MPYVAKTLLKNDFILAINVDVPFASSNFFFCFVITSSRNRAINFDFPPKKGTGIEKLLPHASQQCIELIYKMCTYDPDERITAKQALRHSYFRDLR